MGDLANLTVDLKKLDGTVAVVKGNVDQMFLIFMGCLIFCK